MADQTPRAPLLERGLEQYGDVDGARLGGRKVAERLEALGDLAGAGHVRGHEIPEAASELGVVVSLGQQ